MADTEAANRQRKQEENSVLNERLSFGLMNPQGNSQ
jgi:hypothetical protein